MSLPSHGLIVKDGVIVGVGMCNIGWVFDVRYLPACIKETMTCAYKCVTKDRQELVNFIPWYPWCFGTVEELQTFDGVVVYGYQFDRDVAKSVFAGTMSDDEFVDYIKQGGGIEAFRVNEKAFYVATEALRGPMP